MYQPFYYPPATGYTPANMAGGAMQDYLSQLRAQQQPAPVQMQQQQNTNAGLIWVQGEAGAKSYPAAPGQTVMLMDSEGSFFYLKTADASGMPLPLRVFRFEEITENSARGAVDAVDFGKFITREEFEQRLNAFFNQKAETESE